MSRVKYQLPPRHAGESTGGVVVEVTCPTCDIEVRWSQRVACPICRRDFCSSACFDRHCKSLDVGREMAARAGAFDAPLGLFD